MLDEIQMIAPGENAELTLDLEAGGYVLICKLVEMEQSGEVVAHYAEGMRAAFTVD